MSDLAQLAMWTEWQNFVQQSLPNFCADRVYVEQNSPSQQEFEQVVQHLKGLGYYSNHNHAFNGATMLVDAQYGARVVDTSIGKLTRMWLDAQVEMAFLIRHCPLFQHSRVKVLDVDAGYGRLAVELAPLVHAYLCVDAVPISTRICIEYTGKYGGPNIHVYDIGYFKQVYRNLQPNLAINIHSWNECSLEQIRSWLDVLVEMKCQYLFTVSHGQLDARVQRAYYSWGGDQPSFRPLLEERYELTAEESIGLGSHPHALWRLR